MLQDLQRVRANAAEAATEDLVERVTVFRDQMEPAAVEVIEQELWKRGYGPDRIAAAGRKTVEAAVRRPDGTAAACSICSRVAVASGWGWYRWRGGIPLFPRRMSWCADHRPK